MIKLQWVTKKDFKVENDFWDCSIPDSEIDQAVRDVINFHENKIYIETERIKYNVVLDGDDVTYFFNNRLVLFAFRYYVSLKKLEPNDIEVIINNQTYHIAYNGKMKFESEKEYYEYNRAYDDGDLYDKYLTELAFHVESNPYPNSVKLDKEETKNEN